MANRFDELAKTLAGGGPEEPGVSRRDALRRVGLGLVGAVLGSLGIEPAWAAKGGNGGNPGNGGSGGNSPCGVYCRSSATKAERDRCLQVCQSCSSVSLLCGSGYNTVCTDRATDPRNCGACGHNCGSPPNVSVTCVNGNCQYVCYPGYADCDTSRTNGCEAYLATDVNNCGGCGIVCAGSTPYCVDGACAPCPDPSLTPCNGVCVDTNWNPNNCGACGIVCSGDTPYCSGGSCGPCPDGMVQCGSTCVDPNWDDNNCGGCGVACDTANGLVCCYGACIDYCSCYYCGGGSSW